MNHVIEPATNGITSSEQLKYLYYNFPDSSVATDLTRTHYQKTEYQRIAGTNTPKILQTD